jgi:hypothetical protein
MIRVIMRVITVTTTGKIWLFNDSLVIYSEISGIFVTVYNAFTQQNKKYISPDVSESRARNSISSKPLPGHTLPKKLPDLSVRPCLCPTHIRANALPARSRHKMPPPCIGGTPFCA